MIAALISILLILVIVAGVVWLLREFGAPTGAQKAAWVIGAFIILLILIALLCEISGVWVDGPFQIHTHEVVTVR